MIFASRPRIPVEAATGISAPDRKICGKISSGTPTATTFGSCVRPMKKTPRAPPAMRQDRGEGDDTEQVADVHRDLHDDDHGRRCR